MKVNGDINQVKTYENITQLVGNTPLIRLNNFSRRINAKAEIYAKLESFNPTGSVKDRTALFMIEEGEKQGILTKGSVIIEPTSGNTGIGLAAIGGMKGYSVILTMPETMSVERRNLLEAYGAKLVLTEGKMGMKGAVDEAERLMQSTAGGVILGQFDNPANSKAHRETTGPEIWRDSRGQIDVFVAGIGTGGTITGCGEYLKSVKPGIKIVGVEPAAFPHKIQGIGAGFDPAVLNRDIIDISMYPEDGDAFDMKELLAETEGILAGISGGAALWAAGRLASLPEYAGTSIVVLLADGGEKYLSACR